MTYIRKIIFVFLTLKFKSNFKSLSFNGLDFRRLDFTNYKQIKSFIFKKDFFRLKNEHVVSFEFLNFSQNLGGKIGINLSKNNIFEWYKLNKFKINLCWSEDFVSKRLINILYNYEFINSSSNEHEKKELNKIILFHINIVIFDFNNKRFSEISSYDLVAHSLSYFIMKKSNRKIIDYYDHIVSHQIDHLGMHKSYNILEHAKFLNNLNELKNIFLYFE